MRHMSPKSMLNIWWLCLKPHKGIFEQLTSFMGGRSLMWHNSGLLLQPNPCHYDSNNAPRSLPETHKTTSCRLMIYWFFDYEVCTKGKCWSVGWDSVSGCSWIKQTNQQIQVVLQPTPDPPTHHPPPPPPLSCWASDWHFIPFNF